MRNVNHACIYVSRIIYTKPSLRLKSAYRNGIPDQHPQEQIGSSEYSRSEIKHRMEQIIGLINRI